MAKKRRFHPMVADDLSSATDYYDEISVDLGNRFRSAFRDRLRDLSQRPESFGCVHGIMRVATVNRFSYVLLFENRDEFPQSLASSMLPLIREGGSSVQCDATVVQHCYYARPSHTFVGRQRALALVQFLVIQTPPLR